MLLKGVSPFCIARAKLCYVDSGLAISQSYSHHILAERVTSLGKDWHKPCLRCANENCKKVLSAGSHAEREGKPYCNQCYGALFGPKGFGHGGTESHTFHGGATG
ncbi:unnamed protein product [Cylicostephanus goldi]|uniref:Cysteine-rich protein 1 n=1 Tax=Cylicostephanus goldi TaxID=71465 RepID=A0A3P7PRQ5_CYLGO|nr:unnamed protein product [Cylicostephanus goldi]